MYRLKIPYPARSASYFPDLVGTQGQARADNAALTQPRTSCTLCIYCCRPPTFKPAEMLKGRSISDISLSDLNRKLAFLYTLTHHAPVTLLDLQCDLDFLLLRVSKLYHI